MHRFPFMAFRICPLAALLVLLATTAGRSAEPEQLAAFAKDIQEFAWSLAIETEENGDGRAAAYLAPKAEQFKKSYTQDMANNTVQSWDEYWRWVVTFYKGNLLDKGWAARSKKLADTPEMTQYANVLGRIIASEWSKDNNARAIDTSDVRRWGQALEAASVNDRSGAKRLKALRTVTQQAAAKLRKK